MAARSVNKNVSSSKLKLSADNVKELQRLYVVHRFQKSHGNKKAQAWNYFGFLYYDETDSRRHGDREEQVGKTTLFLFALIAQQRM